MDGAEPNKAGMTGTGAADEPSQSGRLERPEKQVFLTENLPE
jgi:hypothetical protein